MNKRKIIIMSIVAALIITIIGVLIYVSTTLNQNTLGTILFFVIAFSWMTYLLQEMFITGASSLNMSIAKDEGERRQIQVSAGIHFDGVEVWLVGALTLMYGAFPLAFTTTLSHLYIPFFLILYAIIGRGLSIEFLYKLDNEKWLKSMKITWLVSSILLMFLLGIYLTNIFYGFPLGSDGMTEGFLSIFNVTGIVGGLLFVLLSMISGAGWIFLTTSGDLGTKAVHFIKKVGIIYALPVVLLLVFMGFNNTKASIFIGELFTDAPILFALPLLTVVSAILVTLFGYKEDGKKVFIFVLLTMGLFLLTGFVGMYPYMIPSHVLIENGITLFDSMAARNSQLVLVITVLIFFPIIAFYQSWKYMKFTEKVNYNDE